MNDLEAYIRANYGGEWDAGGFNQANAFAQLLANAGITVDDLARGMSIVDTTDYSQLRQDPTTGDWYTIGSGDVGWGTDQWVAPQQAYLQRQLRIGDKTVGFLGDYNNDGTYGTNASQYLQPADRLMWSAQGHGNTGVHLVQNPDGTVTPSAAWGSSSDADKIRTALMVVGGVLGAGYGAQALAGGAAGGAGSVGAGGATGGLSSAELSALYGNAGYGTGMSGLETAAFDSALAGGAASGGGNVLGSWGDWNVDWSQLGSTLGGNNGWGSLINLGGNLLSGYMGSRAAGQASDAQLQAAREALALQAQMYNQTREDFAPYRQAGTSALAQIQNLLANPSAITSQPDYQFGLNEGTRALNNSAAARGMTYSGAQGKALQRFGQDYAGSKLNESYNRLASIAGIGQQATGATSNAGSNYANQGGNQLNNMGDARGSGYMGQANAWAGAVGNYLNNWQQQNMLNQMWGRP